MPPCPCKAHDLRAPAPFGAPSPCCHGGQLRQWLPIYSQYAICRLTDGHGRPVTGCSQVYWHDGRAWQPVSVETQQMLERIV